MQYLSSHYNVTDGYGKCSPKQPFINKRICVSSRFRQVISNCMTAKLRSNLTCASSQPHPLSSQEHAITKQGTLNRLFLIRKLFESHGGGKLVDLYDRLVDYLIVTDREIDMVLKPR